MSHFSTKMKKEIFQEIEIPKDVEARIEGKEIIIKGEKGENKKKLGLKKINFETKNNKIVIRSENASKKEKRLINTFVSHIKNMIHGVSNGFEYKLKIVYSHFPFSVEIHGNEAMIKNFLGEKIPRKAKILFGVHVKVEKDIIKISSCDKELAGQTAANFEKATRISMRDRRVFQDGIFIINKAGEEI